MFVFITILIIEILLIPLISFIFCIVFSNDEQDRFDKCAKKIGQGWDD